MDYFIPTLPYVQDETGSSPSYGFWCLLYYLLYMLLKVFLNPQSPSPTELLCFRIQLYKFPRRFINHMPIVAPHSIEAPYLCHLVSFRWQIKIGSNCLIKCGLLCNERGVQKTGLRAARPQRKLEVICEYPGFQHNCSNSAPVLNGSWSDSVPPAAAITSSHSYKRTFSPLVHLIKHHLL